MGLGIQQIFITIPHLRLMPGAAPRPWQFQKKATKDLKAAIPRATAGRSRRDLLTAAMLQATSAD